MAQVWYDPDGSNTAPYDTQVKAATDLQTAFDTPNAGDFLYLVARATETLGSTIDIDTNAGNLSSGYITVIGVNTSGVDDGTQFVMDGNNAVTNCIKGTTVDYWHLKNIECKNATGDGIESASAAINWIIEDCNIHTNGGAGIDLANFNPITMIRVKCNNNTSYGFNGGYYSAFYYCEAIGNGNYGFRPQQRCKHVGCLSHNNTTGQVEMVSSENAWHHGVIDGWNGSAAAGNGVKIGNINNLVISSRITNCTTGINLTGGDWGVYDLCGFYGNGTDVNIPAGCQMVDLGNNVSMASHGYNSLASDDFNLTAGAELRNTAIPIDATNNYYYAAGLPPLAAGGGGGLLSNRGMNGGING